MLFLFIIIIFHQNPNNNTNYTYFHSLFLVEKIDNFAINKTSTVKVDSWNGINNGDNWIEISSHIYGISTYLKIEIINKKETLTIFFIQSYKFVGYVRNKLVKNGNKSTISVEYQIYQIFLYTSSNVYLGGIFFHF